MAEFRSQLRYNDFRAKVAAAGVAGTINVDLPDVDADDQRLARSHEDVHRAVVLHRRRHRNSFRQLPDEEIPLIEQVIGRLPDAATGQHDVIIDLRDRLGQPIDVVDRDPDTMIHLFIELAESIVERVEPLHRPAGFAEDRLSRRDRRRVIRDVLNSVEESLHTVTQSRQRIGDEAVDLCGECTQDVEAAVTGERVAELLIEHGVVDPLDRGYLRATANESEAAALAAARRELGNLAAVTGRIRIRDIVTGHLQGPLECEHTGQAGREKVRHQCLRASP